MTWIAVPRGPHVFWGLLLNSGLVGHLGNKLAQSLLTWAINPLKCPQSTEIINPSHRGLWPSLMGPAGTSWLTALGDRVPPCLASPPTASEAPGCSLLSRDLSPPLQRECFHWGRIILLTALPSPLCLFISSCFSPPRPSCWALEHWMW